MIIAKLKGFLSQILFEKTLKALCHELSQENQAGKLASLISSDLEFLDGLSILPYVLSTPVFLVGSIILLWFNLGIAGIIGLLVVSLHFPIIMVLGKLTGKYRFASAAIGDSRMKMITNLIEGIRIIKLYGWEHPYLNSVFVTRKQEIAEIKKKGLILCIIRGINYGSTACSVIYNNQIGN